MRSFSGQVGGEHLSLRAAVRMMGDCPWHRGPHRVLAGGHLLIRQINLWRISHTVIQPNPRMRGDGDLTRATQQVGAGLAGS